MFYKHFFISIAEQVLSFELSHVFQSNFVLITAPQRVLIYVIFFNCCSIIWFIWVFVSLIAVKITASLTIL